MPTRAEGGRLSYWIAYDPTGQAFDSERFRIYDQLMLELKPILGDQTYVEALDRDPRYVASLMRIRRDQLFGNAVTRVTQEENDGDF